MKTTPLFTTFLIFAFVTLSLLKGYAQAVGINTTVPNSAAFLHVEADTSKTKGLLVTGTYNSTSTVPDLGAGSRLMFYPGKAAFRAGYVTTSVWDNVNVGRYSFAMGYNPFAGGTGSFAMGNNTVATGINSIALGYNTNSQGNTSTAIGISTFASGDYSTAMGFGTLANGQSSTAMGYATRADKINSTAMGNNTIANGDNSTAMGFNTNAGKINSTAMGSSTIASGDNSTAMGNTTTANGDNSTAMGKYTKAGGYSSTAMGDSTNASGSLATATGFRTTASGSASTAMGNNTTASGHSSTAMGNQTNASGDNSTAMGYQTIASGFAATAVGTNTTAGGTYSTATGFLTTASGHSSTAMGTRMHTGGQFGAFMIGDTDPNAEGTTFSGTPNQFVARFWNGYFFLTSGDDTRFGVQVAHNGNSWISISDKNRKENFEQLDGEDVLQKISNIKFSSWNYKQQDPKIYRHYGIMAQDFYNAFGHDKYGTIGNDTTVNPIDMIGIDMAAIQALEKRTATLISENAILNKKLREVDELKKENEDLKQSVAKLQTQFDEQQKLIAQSLDQLKTLAIKHSNQEKVALK